MNAVAFFEAQLGRYIDWCMGTYMVARVHGWTHTCVGVTRMLQMCDTDVEGTIRGLDTFAR